MGRRRRAREVVLQALYEAEFSESESDGLFERQIERRPLGPEAQEYARSLLHLTLGHKDELDAIIADGLENWAMERVSLVDKNILRMALAEVLYSPDIPANVIINEAIEIANRYSSADAGRFVNGLLDRFVKEHRKGVV